MIQYRNCLAHSVACDPVRIVSAVLSTHHDSSQHVSRGQMSLVPYLSRDTCAPSPSRPARVANFRAGQEAAAGRSIGERRRRGCIVTAAAVQRRTVEGSVRCGAGAG